MNSAPPPPPPKRRMAVPISWKLLGATAVVGAVAAAIAIIGLQKIASLNHSLTQTVDFLSINVKTASLVKQELIAATRAERNMMLAHSKDASERFANLVDDVLDNMEKLLDQFQTIALEVDRPHVELLAQKWELWRDNHQEVRRWMEVDSDIQAHNISVGEARQAIDRLQKGVDAIAQQAQRDLEAAQRDEDSEQRVSAVERMTLAADILRDALEMQRNEKDLILATTEEEMLGYEATFAPLEESLNNHIARLAENVDESETVEVGDLRQAYQDYLSANERVRQAAGEKSSDMAHHLVYDVGAPLAAECESMLDSLIANKEKRMQQYRRAGEQTYTNARNTLLGISIFGIFFSVATSFLTGQRIARRLSVLSRYASSIHTTGDLSKPTPNLGSDEVGMLAESFESMRQSLHTSAEKLNEQTATLAELSTSLAANNREMEQFVYTVSHDLKSPLVSCKGLLGLLKEDVAERDYEAIVDSADRLDEATDQLNQIIDDLLMLSRIGRKTLSMTEVDIEELVHDLMDELADRIAATGAKIDIQKGLPKVTADLSDMRRVFENLITNALKYGCKQPNAMITVGGHLERREVRYFVHDEGPGIDPKYHDKVFGLFQRLQTDQPGTGLGLASVAKIVEMHGGRTWIESQPGQGATFWVALPAR